MPGLLRLLAKPNRLFSSSSHLLNISLRFHRPITSTPAQSPPPPNPRPRTRTPLEKQFESWIDKLRPGFGPPEVADALRAQSDPDLALDIFRWAAQQRGYRHDAAAYLAIIKILISGRRHRHDETLVKEVVARACEMSVPLYNSVIRFYCGHKFLFNRAFDVYKKMVRSEECKPTL